MKLEDAEWLKMAVPLPDGDENDPGNHHMIEKYGDRLSFKMCTAGHPWEQWIDVVGKNSGIVILPAIINRFFPIFSRAKRTPGRRGFSMCA